MTTLAAGSSVTVVLRDTGQCTVTTSGGFADVAETVGGTTTNHAFGPRPKRRVFGPYSEGATIVITNASAVLDYDSPYGNLVTFDEATQSLVSGDENLPVAIRFGATDLRADVIVYGATPSGIQAAITAKKGGVSVILISPNGRVGGLVTGGLARTDYRGFNPRVAMNVGTADFFRRAALHYGYSLGYYGMDNTSPYAIEPKVALEIFKDQLNEYEIPVVRDYRVTAVNSQAGDIKSITLAHRTSGQAKTASALIFIDASYECDLLIRSGVTYTYGREANATYTETYNGVRASAALTGSPSPYVTAGDAGSGLLPYIDAATVETAGTADTRIQAYCHRLVMTNDASNRIAIPEPDNYNPLWHEVIGRGMANAPTSLDSLDEMFYRAAIPLGGTAKQDWNNNGVSLDFVGGNAGFVTTDYAARDQIVQNHKDYTLGLFKFLREDSRVPTALRSALAEWGFCADEFVGEGTRGLSPELYVRESARMVGDYVMTEANWAKTENAVHPVALCNYAIDSHPCSKRNISGVTHSEGGLSSSLVPTGYYGFEYRAMLPKARECGNMLVCGNGVSASHTLFGSARMEVTLMSLGEAAGAAAALAIKGKSRLHDIAGSDINPLTRPYNLDPSRVLTINAPSTNGSATLSSVPPSGWTYQTWPPEFLSTRLVNEGNGNKGGRWAQFEPTFAADGRYRIMLNAPGSTNSQLRCKVDVTHVGGVDTFYIDHKYGEWHFRDLGVWEFSTTVGTIRITNAEDPAVSGSGNGILSVDAVAWNPVP